MPAKAYRSIALLRSLARMLARPLFFGKKLIVQVSHPRLVCALLIREHAVSFFATAVMSLFSEPNAHCEVAEALTMPKNTILRLIDFLRRGARKPAIFLIANPHG